MISIPLLYSQPYPCSYLDNQLARPAFAHPLAEITTEIYSELIQQGFRRSGNEVYVPYCPLCSACVPARLQVSEFIPSRSQKRCLSKNGQTESVIKAPEFNQEHYDLYRRYQSIRHYDGDMQYSSPEEYISFLSSRWCDTVFIEFKLKGRLAAVAVVDRLNNALSSVYTFFDPEFSDYGLGSYAILWQVKWARQLCKEFVYLGFWIKECRKMAYKANYQPLQILQNNQWMSYESVVSGRAPK